MRRMSELLKSFLEFPDYMVPSQAQVGLNIALTQVCNSGFSPAL